MRALRLGVDEDRHRGDDLAPLDVRDVEALDPHRQALEVERLAQLLERLDTPLPALLARREVVLQREPRILLRELGETPLLAALRSANLDPCAAQIAEERGERLRVLDVGRDDHLRRHRGRAAVVLDAERLEDRGAVLPCDVLQVEGKPVDELAVAEREELHRGAVAVDCESDDVDRPHRLLVRCLPLREALDRAQPVAVASGLLEALLGSGVAHPLLERAPDRPCLAGEELDHPLDDRPVVLLRDRADAGSRAALDVEVEARDPGVPTRLRPLARAELEHAVQHVESLPHLLRVRVRPEVDGVAPVPLAREHHARVGVGDRHRDVRERLVVAETDVERRPVPLDEILLEVERLGLALRHDHLDPVDALDELADARAGVAAAVPVAPDAGTQRFRLADVEDLVALVAKQVHARTRRQPFQLLPNGIFTHRS